jgi:hypothetical protein
VRKNYRAWLVSRRRRRELFYGIEDFPPVADGLQF